MRKSVLLAGISILALVSACAHHPDYELCDTPDCGDDVTVVVE